MRALDPTLLFPLVAAFVGCRLLLTNNLAEVAWARRAVASFPSRVQKYLVSSGLDVDLQLAGVGLDATSFRACQLAFATIGALVGGTLYSAVSGASRIGLSGYTWQGGIRQLAATTLFAAFVSGGGLEFFVKHRAEKARDRVAADVANLADLLCIAISSGESVRSGLAAISGLVEHPLQSEVTTVVAAVTSGTPFEVALTAFAERIRRPAVNVLAEALGRAHERGVGLTDQLRALARDVREARKAAVVESMGKRQMLMIVPVVFLILPTALVFAALPGFYTLRLVMG